MQTLHMKTLILSHSFMSAFVRNCNFTMSASIFKCRHADIKVYNFTNVITIFNVNTMLYYQL